MSNFCGSRNLLFLQISERWSVFLYQLANVRILIQPEVILLL